MQQGEAQALGRLMREAQSQFDAHLQPACPSQLTAPVLHALLNNPPIQKLVLGGKGVGSQGDGTAQFLVADEAAQDRLVEIIARDHKLTGLKLTIHKSRAVKKAVIAAAGFGTRLYPATKVIRKEMLPVMDTDGRMKPAILVIVEEALSAGIEEICLVVQPQDKAGFEEFFQAPPPVAHFNKLSKENQAYTRTLLEIGRRITLVTQDVQDGFGHAVYGCKEWVGGEPFLLLLGDHLHRSSIDKSCSRQIVEMYEKMGRSVVGLNATPGEQIRHFGCVTGVWEEEGAELAITRFAEKPELEWARMHLHMAGLAEDEFLTVFGQYLLTPRIFDFLEENIIGNVRERGEFQLTSCLDRLRQEEGFTGLVIQGQRFDIGLPGGYAHAVAAFAAQG
jgi:UTP-glucose-1-phosphate uridylyltransferase